MFNLKFGAFVFALCLLLTSCVCESNETASCKIHEKTATCESNVDFKSLDTTITKLIVRNKELQRIGKDDLALFVNLEEIDLSECGLEEIDENALIDLNKLHKINLAGNKKLKLLSDQSFLSSDTVTCLNLSNTGVEELDILVKHLPKLQDLDLSGTNIKDFSPLEHLKDLAKLVVSTTNETETLELCNISTIKDIFEKDENGTEAKLDCETLKKNAQIEATTAPKIEAKVEAKIDTKLDAKIEPVTLENKTEVVSIAPIKKEEAPIVATKNITNVSENLQENKVIKETSEAPKLLHESSVIEATTATAVVEVQPNKTTEYITTPKDEIKPGEPEKKDVEQKPDEPVVKEDKIKPDETIKPEEVKKAAEENEIAPRLGSIDKGSNEKPQVVLDASDDVILPSTENKSQSNGVNIVLGIILCVMVVGAVGFGFKYWKSRRSGYTHANTHDHEDEDKELQTIVAHRTDTEQN